MDLARWRARLSCLGQGRCAPCSGRRGPWRSWVPLGGQNSRAFGINNAGTVCGLAQDASGNLWPALWNGSVVTGLPSLGAAGGAAWGINDAGTAVGNSYLSTGGYHAAVWSAGGVRDLGTLGGALSVAYDINNQER